MSTNERWFTSSGDFGPPEGGVLQCIVPALHMSSSYNGQGVFRASGVEDADGRESAFAPPLRLRGGGEERDSNEEEERRETGKGDQDFNIPEPSTRRKPGPKSKTTGWRGSRGRSAEAGRKEREGSEDARDRDRSSELEKEREEDLHLPLTPAAGGTTPGTAGTDAGFPVTEEGKRTQQKAGERSGRNSPAPRDDSPMSLGGSSIGSKRTREREEEKEIEEFSSDDSPDPPSPATKVLKRRKDGSVERRGRPAKNPQREGEFTREKIAARVKAAKEKKIGEIEVWLGDSSTKASPTNRAEAAERNALRILREMNEVPTASITQMGIEAVERVKKVVTSSKTLTGAYVGALWGTVEEMTAINLALTRRAQEARDEEGERRASELENMRREISSLRTSEALLQGQVRALREAVAQGEALRAVVPASTEGEATSQRKRKRGGRKNYAISSSSEEDVDMEDIVRDLSPLLREVGRKAREEVEKDRREGMMPPVVRPPIKGRPATLESGGVPPASAAEVLPPSPRTTIPTPPPRSGSGRIPGGDWSMEGIVQAVVRTLTASGLIPSPSIPATAPGGELTRGPKEPQGGKESGRKDPLQPLATPVVATAGVQGAKKNKKKKMKGRSRNAGAVAPSPRPDPSSGMEETPTPASQVIVSGGGPEQPRPTPPSETWAEVARRGKKKAAGATSGGGQAPLPKNVQQPLVGKGGKGKGGVSLPRGPRGAAVTLTCPEGKYSQVLMEARGKIKLEELGISGIRSRRAVTGALVLEIPGQEGSTKAEALRKKMADLFAGREAIKVSRPVKRSEIKVRDLDDSVTVLDGNG